jgi:hypothetical protein
MAVDLKLKRSHTHSTIPSTSDLVEGEIAVNTYDRKMYMRDGSSNIVTVSNHYATDYESATKVLYVTVATSTTDHPYHGTGSSNKYKINGIFSPYLHLIPKNTYRFDQSDSSNSGHPLRFYLEADKTTAYTSGVTTNGTPGSAGAYTQIVVSDTTPSVLHYQCSAHGNMGWAVFTNTRNLTNFDTDDLAEGSNLYYTDARAQAVSINNVVEDTSPQLGGALDTNGNEIQLSQTSGVGIRTLSVVDFNNNQYEIDPYTPSDIQAKYPNSLMERLGFTFRQLANYKGFPHVLFTQKTYESAKPTTFPTYFPYPLTTNYRFDTAKNIGLSVNNHNLPMFNLSTQREYKNINLSASSDTAFAVNLPIKAETPFYLVKSDIFEGDVAFNSENGGSTENIMIICNKAYTNLDYGYSFGTQYSFKATKSFVISGIKTSILKPDLTPADIDKGTAVIYKVVSPIKYFEEQAEAEQLQNKKLSNKGGEGKK